MTCADRSLFDDSTMWYVATQCCSNGPSTQAATPWIDQPDQSAASFIPAQAFVEAFAPVGTNIPTAANTVRAPVPTSAAYAGTRANMPETAPAPSTSRSWFQPPGFYGGPDADASYGPDEDQRADASSMGVYGNAVADRGAAGAYGSSPSSFMRTAPAAAATANGAPLSGAASYKCRRSDR